MINTFKMFKSPSANVIEPRGQSGQASFGYTNVQVTQLELLFAAKLTLCMCLDFCSQCMQSSVAAPQNNEHADKVMKKLH